MKYVHEYLSHLGRTLEELPVEAIHRVTEVLLEARVRGRKVLIMGNGGSASTASHFACDLAKNTRLEGWPDFRVVALTDNMATFSAYANDEGYDQVFARQLASLVEPADVVIAISTSGNSPNVLEAAAVANRVGAVTVGFTGFDGGRLGSAVQHHVHVPSDCIEHVEDIHLVLEHLICKALRERVADLRLPAQPYQEPETTPAEVLDAISQQVNSQRDLGGLLQEALRLTVESVGAASGSILVLNGRKEVVEGAVAYAGKVRRRPGPVLVEMVRSGLAGWVASHQRPALIRSTRDDPRWLRRAWDEDADTPRSAISVPLMAGERVVGVLTLVHREKKQFTEADLTLLAAIAACVSLGGARVFEESRNGPIRQPASGD